MSGTNGQCPTCGRCDPDWTALASKHLMANGAKARQRTSIEDRTAKYRDWRRTLNRQLYVSDIDQMEWRIVDDEVEPVALLELTRIDGDLPIPPTYLAHILDRMYK